jgi:phosphoglycolate phosphatase
LGAPNVKRNACGAQRPAAVVFDLDGTLADSFDAIARALNAALGELDLPAKNHEWVCRHVGRGAGELIRDALGPDCEDSRRRDLGRRFLATYEATFCAQTLPMPDAREVLRWVSAGTDGRVAVVSNKLERLSRAWLRHWDMDALVAVVIGPDSAGVHKPDPRSVLPALARLGVAPGDALLVGDMEVDALTGQEAGIPVVGVHNPYVPAAAMRAAGALEVLEAVRDLPRWLVGNGRGWATIPLANAGGER